MPKRKLSELNGPARSSDARKLSMQAVRLTNKFDNGVQLLIRGLKVARGFERQKLSRREKTAKSQENASTTLSRLAEEVKALKELDYHATAEKYLFKQLSKTKRIAESSVFGEFQESKKISTEGPKSTAEANIQARLFKSTPVQKVLPDIMAGIRTLLKLEEVPAGKQQNTKPKTDTAQKDKSARRKPDEVESESSSAEDKEAKTDTKKKPVSASERIFQSEEDQDISGAEGSGSEDFAEFDNLVGSSDSEDENSAKHDLQTQHNRQATTADDISISSVSRSPSPSHSFSAAEDSPPPPTKKPKGSTKSSKAPATDTTFLPSLMMGGYWSGSESEATDDEAAAGPPKRKNRMGQQARRALWEKKYGEKANHVQKEMKKQKKNRDSGWDVKRGATDAGRRGRRPQNRRDEQTGANTMPLGKAKSAAQDSGPLHPSWEAKKKAKEQASTASFQGKKVVFD
ncbi:hypothetical protein N7474_002709 [Penicillium riverlandense]|uniref:uncharacterized protein n=1 Tax=Penicillium riverlandense TaxID=1903569 RepID=UPI0025490494|nr:uncharacterized protein N7474_002709 [Penicillium riverlandense]KAJ5825571.1 hypothetical protein N7474_002709 [Penicillium riverlandense]